MRTGEWGRVRLIEQGVAVVSVVGTCPSWRQSMVITGAFGATRAIAMSGLLDHVAPPTAMTESYASMVSAGLLGMAVGNGAGGVLTAALGPRRMLITAAGTAALVTMARRRRWEPPADVPVVGRLWGQCPSG